jgi:cell wall-associated NlpC family hydrolase
VAKIHAERARKLLGAPFRPQGRDPKLGLDCVGLCLAAYRMTADGTRRDYRLRGAHRAELQLALSRHFRRISRRSMRQGDLLLLAVAPDQFHLAVLTEAGFIHADARLRRVVETPGEPGWRLIAAYRRRRERKI